jgi:HEPN domain-containing protein
LPRPEHVGVADVLLRKAASDLAVARDIAPNPDHLDDAVGFHVQQAVEKSLKAMLALEELPIPRTHDLTFLVELLVEHGIAPPAPVSRAEWLSPWAVSTRYEDIDDTLDREQAIQLASLAVEWARGLRLAIDLGEA